MQECLQVSAHGWKKETMFNKIFLLWRRENFKWHENKSKSARGFCSPVVTWAQTRWRLSCDTAFSTLIALWISFFTRTKSKAQWKMDDSKVSRSTIAPGAKYDQYKVSLLAISASSIFSSPYLSWREVLMFPVRHLYDVTGCIQNGNRHSFCKISRMLLLFVLIKRAALTAW